MGETGRLTVFAVAAVLFLYFIVRMRAKREGDDGEWGVLVRCRACGKMLPRWYFHKKGTPRGPVSRSHYPLPETCRKCAHTTGLPPLDWIEGETEHAYDARSDETSRERAERLMR